MLKRTMLSILLAGMSLCAAAAQKPAEWKVSEDTVIMIKADQGELKEWVTGKELKTGTLSIQKDDVLGDVLVAGDTGSKGIAFEYKGDGDNVFRGKGMSLEAWIKPESYNFSGNFFTILGLANVTFKAGNDGTVMTADWISFPTEKNYVEPEMKGKRLPYSGGTLTFNGQKLLKSGEWNHVAIVYDEELRIVYSWINGELDRECEILGTKPAFLKMVKTTQHFFRSGKNVAFGGFRLRSGVHHPASPPPMKHYLNLLPWEGRMVMTVEKFAHELKFPLTMKVVMDGGTVHSMNITERKTTHLNIPYIDGQTSFHDLTMEVTDADGKSVYKAEEQYTCKRPPAKGGVQIHPDKTMSYNGKKFLPMIIYGVTAKDLPEIKAMGFNSATPRDTRVPWYTLPSRETYRMLQWCEKAIENDMLLQFNANAAEDNVLNYIDKLSKLKNAFYWYNASEPWRGWEDFKTTYILLHSRDGSLPAFNGQCSSVHMKNSSVSCDILACDPYPIPNVSLRSVAGLTKSALEGSFHLKPVWTILGCYKPKIPNLQELNCMTAIALASGATGLGIYAWDERLQKTPNSYYTPNYPEVHAMLKKYMKELMSIEWILAEANLPVKLVDQLKQPAIHASLKRAKGKTYLIIANDQRCPETGEIVLPENMKFKQAIPLKTFGFKKRLVFKDGKCNYEFPALAAGIFELKKK